MLYNKLQYNVEIFNTQAVWLQETQIECPHELSLFIDEESLSPLTDLGLRLELERNAYYKATHVLRDELYKAVLVQKPSSIDLSFLEKPFILANPNTIDLPTFKKGKRSVLILDTNFPRNKVVAADEIFCTLGYTEPELQLIPPRRLELKMTFGFVFDNSKFEVVDVR